MSSSMIRMSFSILSICAAALLLGCASPIKSDVPTGNNMTGMVYALPKGQVQFTASRKKITEDDVAAAQKAAADIAAMLAADKKALADAKAALIAAQGALSSADASVKEELTKRAALAKAITDYLTLKVAAETKSAAAAEKLSKEATASAGKWMETASLSQLSPVPDESRRFVAKLDHGITRNDKMKMSVAGGLLSTTSATSDDQSVSIILNLVQGVAAFAGPAARSQFALRNFPLNAPALGTECKPYSFSAIIDPGNPAEVKQLQDDFLAKKPTIRLTVAERVTSVVVTTATSQAEGLVYRAPRAISMKIEAPQLTQSPCEIGAQVDAATFIAIVPDLSAEFVLGSRVGPFTKTVFDFSFKDGMPTDYSVEQPSELAAIASLPLDIAKAIVSVPASIIKLRVDYDSQANATIEAKTAMLNAQLAQVNAQKALDEAMIKPDN